VTGVQTCALPIYVGDFLSAKYNQALDQSVPSVVQGDAAFQGGLSQLSSMVPTQFRDDFIRVIQNNITNKITPGGTLTPSVARAADSELGRIASLYRGSQGGAEREYGLALAEAQQELRSLVARNNPNVAPIINAANEGWSQLVQIENAAATIGAKNGLISPAQYLNAVKKSDDRIRSRGFSRGEAQNQDFAAAASNVLPSQYPDSGTAGRYMAGAILGGGLAHLSPPVLGAGGVAALAYTPTLNQLLSKIVAGNRPDAAVTLSGILKQGAPYAALPLGASMNSQP
jgi:hypothetical protein